MAETKTTELYNRAIKELNIVIGNPLTDEATRTAASKQVKVYRTKAKEAALDALTDRTPALTALMGELDSVIKKAEGGGSSEAVTKLKGFVGEIQGYIDLGKRLG